ncbi:MAG: SurA N-terminal domain-containing protein [Burkholderiales bacterium]
MSIFDLVERNKRLIQILMVLIAITFVTWGLESYTRGPSVSTVATVNGAKISEREFSEELRRQQEQLRAVVGRDFDLSAMDTPEARSVVLDSMISRRLVASEAVGANLIVDDEALRETILSIPAFQVGGSFSREQYEAVLRAQGQTPASFEATLRYDMSVGQLTRAVAETAIQPRALAERIARLEGQGREVQEALIPATQFAAEVQVDEAQVKSYYEANQDEFRTPERVRAEFLVLSADEIGAAIPPSEEEVKKAYEARASQYQVPEQRRASHILVKTREEADRLLAEARQSPQRFAELAKKHSQDSGSAEQGGDLGFFARGMMVKPFEDAVFAGKEGETLGPVESEFGHHVIRITGIQAAKARPLEEVRAQIVAEIGRQAGIRKFAEVAEQFSNLVYEQSDSLQPAGEKLKLKLQTSDWVSRTAAPDAGVFANPKLLAALFSDDALKARRNTDAIEVATNTLVSARVAEHQPAALRPLEEVKAEIERKLRNRAAAALAHKAGAAKLEELAKGGDAGLKWSLPKTVSRRQSTDMSPDALRKVFSVDPAKVPAHFGVAQDDGYRLYRIARLLPLEPRKDEERKAGLVNAERQAGAEQYQAYVEALRLRADIDVNKPALEKR